MVGIHPAEDRLEQWIRFREHCFVEARRESFEPLASAERFIKRLRPLDQLRWQRIPEAGIPVRAIAERLVPREPATAQHLALTGFIRAAVSAHDLDRSPHTVRPIDRGRDRWALMMLDRFATVLACVCERTGWARADDVNDLGRGGAFRINERLLVGPKDGRQPTRALPVMATDAAIVGD